MGRNKELEQLVSDVVNERIRALTPDVRPTTVVVTQRYGGEEGGASEEIEVRAFAVPPCEVHASYGLTLNLGDYESARVEAKIVVPCYYEERFEAFKDAWQICHDQVQERVRGVRAYTEERAAAKRGRGGNH